MSKFVKNLLITVLVVIVLWYLFKSSCACSLKKKLCNATCGTNSPSTSETNAENMTTVESKDTVVDDIEVIGVQVKDLSDGFNNVDITDKLSLGAPLNAGTTPSPSQTNMGTPVIAVKVAPIEATGETSGAVSGNVTTSTVTGPVTMGADIQTTAMLIETFNWEKTINDSVKNAVKNVGGTAKKIQHKLTGKK